MDTLTVAKTVLSKALEQKALDVDSGRFIAGGLKFSDDATSGKNYGWDAAAYLYSCGGTIEFTKEDEDIYNSIYEKAAGEYHAQGMKTRERMAKAEDYGKAMKSGFQTLQNYLEDRGIYLYRIQGRGNLVTLITIDPSFMVQTRINGQFVALQAKDAYEARQVSTAEGNIARAADVIAAVSKGDNSKVHQILGNMVNRGIEKAKAKQAARIALPQLED